MKGPVLVFEVLPEDCKVEELKQRLEQQVEVIRHDVSFSKINDTEKALNYAKKIEEILALPCFRTKANRSLTIGTLKEHLKADTYASKLTKDFYKALINFKRAEKLGISKKYLGPKTLVDNSKPLIEYYRHNIKFMKTYLADVTQKVKLCSAFEWFFKYFKAEINRQWKGTTLISFIDEKIEKFMVEEIQLNKRESTIMTAIASARKDNISYFKLKKYKEMEVSKFESEILREISCGKGLIEVISACINEVNTLVTETRELETAKVEREVAIQRVHDVCDAELNSISDLYNTAEDKYNLYRYFQGILKDNIFKSLYA